MSVKLIFKLAASIFALLVGLLFVELSYEVSYRLIFGKASYSIKAVFPIPQANFELILERRAAHVFLTEYERTLILRNTQKELWRKCIASDTSGYSRLNVYQISPTKYLLIGYMDGYEFDSAQQQIKSFSHEEKLPTAIFRGAFDQDKNRRWRFIAADEREELKVEF